MHNFTLLYTCLEVMTIMKSYLIIQKHLTKMSGPFQTFLSLMGLLI